MKNQLNKLAEMNKQFLSGDEEQKKQIRQQLIDFFSEENYPYSIQLKQLKTEQEQLIKVISSEKDLDSAKINSYLKQINTIQEQIKSYANKLQEHSKLEEEHQFLDSMLEQIKNETK